MYTNGVRIMEKFYQELAQVLQSKRLDKGLSQQEVADKIGMTRSCIANWEQGRRRIDIDTMYRICKVLDIDIVELTAHMKRFI